MTEEQQKEITCLEIEYANKPTLLSKAYNNARTCVVVIDMTDGFCKKGALYSPRVAKLIGPIEMALEFLPKANKTFLVDLHNRDSLEFKTFPMHCHTKEESAIVAELVRFPNQVIPKNSTNGIFAYISKVDTRDYDNFLIMGDCTDICILQFALSLKAYLNERGQRANVITFTEYTDTFDMDLHNPQLANLFAYKNMEQSGISVFKKLV